MIPKIIHYCWFGKNPLPEMAVHCIASWKKFCPEYQIIEWNEDNFDLTSAPLYVRQAYEAKKYAFVSDYVRLWALVNNGGVYMDTDVELLKPLDAFLNGDAFSGFETQTNIPTGLMACRADFPLFVELLHEYDTISFILPDGSYDVTTNVVRITNKCNEYGFVPNGEYQVVAGFELYPKDYFCPKDYETKNIRLTENSVCIHHFDGSWKSELDHLTSKLTARYRKFMPKKAAGLMGRFVASVRVEGFKAACARVGGFIFHSDKK